VLGALRSMPVAGALPCCAIATAGKVRKMTGASLCCPSWAKTRSEAPDEMPVWAFQPYTEGTVFGTDAGIDDDVRWLSPRDIERIGYPTQKSVSLYSGRRIVTFTPCSERGPLRHLDFAQYP
jgi:hypothetical protein